jgi:hypothetical protein
VIILMSTLSSYKFIQQCKSDNESIGERLKEDPELPVTS